MQQLQQRKQKQEELAALNAKLKSLSVEDDEHQKSTNALRNRDETSEEQSKSTSEQRIKIVPQRKVAPLSSRSPGDLGAQAANNEGPDNLATGIDTNGEQDFLQRVIHFSDSDSVQSEDTGGSENENEDDQSEDEENDSLAVKDITVHSRNHDTKRNAASNQEPSADNINRNNGNSLATVSDSSRSSRAVETRSVSPSDNRLIHSSNHPSSSGEPGEENAFNSKSKHNADSTNFQKVPASNNGAHS